MKDINLKGIVIVLIAFWLMFGGGYTQVKKWQSGFDVSSVPQAVINGSKIVASSNDIISRPTTTTASRPANHNVSMAVASPTPTAVAVADSTVDDKQVEKVIPRGMPDSAKAPTASPYPTWPSPSPIPDSQYVFVNLGQPGDGWWCVQVPSISEQACSPDPYMVDNTKAQEDAARMLITGIMTGEPIGTPKH